MGPFVGCALASFFALPEARFESEICIGCPGGRRYIPYKEENVLTPPRDIDDFWDTLYI